MSARATTVADLVHALLGGRRQEAIDSAVSDEARRLAGEISEPEIETIVERRAPGEYLVRATGPKLFAREYGSLDQVPLRPLSRAIHRRTEGGGA